MESARFFMGQLNERAEQLLQIRCSSSAYQSFLAMDFKQLVLSTRSHRKFDSECHISRQQLEDLVDLARWTASARNLQPLKYFLSNDSSTNAIIFNHIAWAGYLKDGAPKAGEYPTAYIVMLVDRTLTQANPEWDEGIASQTIMYGAAEQGLGGCIIGAIKKQALAEALALPNTLEIALVLALGRPTDTIVVEELSSEGDIKYYRDNNSVHHVPKRRLDDIIVK